MKLVSSPSSGNERIERLETSANIPILLRQRGRIDYADAQAQMQAFSSTASANTSDELWLVEHPATYTKGTACDQQTLLPSSIPVINSDRGGQITYHGPGQVVLYPLISLRRHGLTVRSIVNRLEQSVINLLDKYGIQGERRNGAPGIYVDEKKIAALGLRIRRGWSSHGLSLNVDMDLTPFDNIDPCGYVGLQATQMADCQTKSTFEAPVVGRQLAGEFCALL